MAAAGATAAAAQAASVRRLPPGWSESRIGDVVQDRIEQGLPEDAREFTYVDISAVDNQLKEITEPKVLPAAKAPSRARQRIKAGDVLVSTTRPNLNGVALVPPKLDGAIASTGFAVLRPILLESRWLFSVVQSEDFVTEMSALVKGALYPAIRPGHVHDYVMPVPPLAEQKRITSKLGKLLKRTRNVHAALEALPELIKQYRAAVLEAACTGRLVPTEAELARKERRDFEPASVLLERILVERRAKWEADQLAKMRAAGKEPKDNKWKINYQPPTEPEEATLPALPEGWTWAALDQLVEEGRAIIYGIIKPGPHTPSGVPYVRVNEMKDGSIDVSSLRRASQLRALKFKRATLKSGDVLISKDGTIGKVAVVPPELEGGNITQHLVRVSIHDFLSRDFVVQALRSEFSQRWLTGETKGVALQGVNVEDFRKLPIPIPPLAEQKNIATEAIKRLAAMKQVEGRIQAALQETTQLRRSFLHRALSGKLVVQSTNDKAASLLLETIAVARQSRQENRNKKARKPMNKKKETTTAKRELLEILGESGDGLTPDQLMTDAGYTPEEVPAFYKALRKVEGEIQEVRPERKVVILKRRRL
jgi:type I restriction enzyme S subunit